MFGINKKNIFDFVEDTITINKDNPLKEGIDFEIVPIDVITDDFDVYTDNYILLKNQSFQTRFLPSFSFSKFDFSENLLSSN